MGFFILTVYCLKVVSIAVLFLASWSRHDKSVCIQESMAVMPCKFNSPLAAFPAACPSTRWWGVAIGMRLGDKKITCPRPRMNSHG